MPQSSHYLQALLGVLSGSARLRRRIYAQQQALVSNLYPIAQIESLLTQNSLVSIELVYVKPPVVVVGSDSLLNLNNMHSVELRTPRISATSSDSISISSGVYAVQLDLALKSIGINDSISAVNNVYAAELLQAGLYIPVQESIQINSAIYGVSMELG